jgi:hypothetical protein
MSKKFKTGELVKFKKSKTKYKVILSYPTDNGFKYDLLSMNGLKQPKGVFESELVSIDIGDFPKGAVEELSKIGTKKK